MKIKTLLFLGLVSLSVSLRAQEGYELRVLTFEDADFKGDTHSSISGVASWSSLIDNPQRHGDLLYSGKGYYWNDDGNTLLHHDLVHKTGKRTFTGGGHAVSHYASGDPATYGDSFSQLTVYADGAEGLASSGGGHNGSDNFCINYSLSPTINAFPALCFKDYLPRVIDHLWVNNTTYFLNAVLNGAAGCPPLTADDWVKVTATGYDGQRSEVGSAEFYLAKGTDVVKEWTKWDLSVLGPVVTVRFSISSNLNQGRGFGGTSYFAYDDVAVRFPKGEVRKDYVEKVLTFEDADFKGDEDSSVSGVASWSSLIDNPQYDGELLYGGKFYYWQDNNNTLLCHDIPYVAGGLSYRFGGHAVSHYASGDLATYGDSLSQLTVYADGVEGLATAGGGHNGSDNFCINNSYGHSGGRPVTLYFQDRVSRVIDHLWVNNTAYFLNAVLNGAGGCPTPGPEDWVMITATGFDEYGNRIGSTDFYLAKGTDVVKEWTKWDLSVLGPVKDVYFYISSTLTDESGLAVPAYFAYDDVMVRFPKDYVERVLTFEDAYFLGDTSSSVSGVASWSSLIDDSQYDGDLLYGGIRYFWNDDNNTMLHHEFADRFGDLKYWGGGHAVSHYASGDPATYGGYASQLTVYAEGVEGLATSGGGHNGSDNFCVHNGSDPSGKKLPALLFNDFEAHVIDHLWVNNTAYFLNAVLNGAGGCPTLEEDDWVKITATGYNESGQKTGTADFYLADGTDVVKEWTKWDLSELGPVMSVEFNISGTLTDKYGLAAPAYFAYDDLTVRFPKGAVGITRTPAVVRPQSDAIYRLDGTRVQKLQRGLYIVNGRKILVR